MVTSGGPNTAAMRKEPTLKREIEKMRTRIFYSPVIQFKFLVLVTYIVANHIPVTRTKH